jgi:hypothetical protein
VQALSEVLFELEQALAWWPLLIVGAEALALLTIPSVLLQRRGQPLAALSWVLALIAVPLGGATPTTSSPPRDPGTTAHRRRPRATSCP